jgi:predicted dehydrogenase
VSANTTLLRDYLAPVDTVDAIFKTKSGITGTFSVSFGSTFVGSEYAIACEQGTVTVTKGAEGGPAIRTKVIVTCNGEQDVKDFDDESMGVKQEVKAWADALEKGKPNDAQSPEEALKDLEIVSKSKRDKKAGAYHNKAGSHDTKRREGWCFSGA